MLYENGLGGDLAPGYMIGKDASRFIPLGEISPSSMADLKLTLTIAPKMGNEYQELLAKVDWLVETRWTPDPGPTPDDPGKEIPEEKLPVEEVVEPEIEMIEEEIPIEPIPGQ